MPPFRLDAPALQLVAPLHEASRQVPVPGRQDSDHFLHPAAHPLIERLQIRLVLGRQDRPLPGPPDRRAAQALVDRVADRLKFAREIEQAKLRTGVPRGHGLARHLAQVEFDRVVPLVDPVVALSHLLGKGRVPLDNRLPRPGEHAFHIFGQTQGLPSGIGQGEDGACQGRRIEVRRREGGITSPPNTAPSSRLSGRLRGNSGKGDRQVESRVKIRRLPRDSARRERPKAEQGPEEKERRGDGERFQKQVPRGELPARGGRQPNRHRDQPDP